MIKFEHLFFAILQLGALFPTTLVQAQDQLGFISIDCGASDSSYTDEQTGLTYLSDTNFVESGENGDILSAYKAQTDEQQFWNLRSFSEGARNCYTLEPSGDSGTRYLIRARFMYGNYDNKRKFPTFDLYIGVDLWTTVVIDTAQAIVDKEILHIPSSDKIHVCLVNTNSGIPFISALELRPLANGSYESATASLVLFQRYDFGQAETNKIMRYEDDAFDRLWSGMTSDAWIPLNFSLGETSVSQNSYDLPFEVISTAYTKSRGESYMQLGWDGLKISAKYYFAMHFSELEKLNQNESREFNVYSNGNLWYESFSPRYLFTITLYSKGYTKPNSDGKLQLSFNKTNNSTLPPLLNAFEIYSLLDNPGQETYQTDVNAIFNVKSEYDVKIENWQGDPCAPKDYLWDGLNCSYTDNLPPRIISLNLSSSGLKGGIVPSISNLTMLQYLDLSNNNLTGTVPEFLANLSFLKVLNLKGNSFLKPVPEALLSKEGLQLSLDANLVNTTSPSSGPIRKKKNLVVPLVAALGGVLLVVLIIVFVTWNLKRRRPQSTTDPRIETIHAEPREEGVALVSKNQQFSFSEIQNITNNFQRVLGEGGFGKVYHGYLNRNEVAVKMLSSPSVQGHRQFYAELKLLLRVHHKNLTTLVGYCNEGANVGLIYEYMAMGNLRSHISGRRQTVLSWEDRLRIAIDTAQGLEYLHNGCKPPIVHRDVKSTNILLNEKFQAKLGDFGLSKIFPLEGGNHVSDTGTPGITTSIAGTPGYLDPEYYITNWLNEKSDVYSFGVVLLEIITARPVLTKTRENNYIIEWVSSMLATGDIKSILDPRLAGDCDINTVWKTIEIAMACVSKTSSNRPTMSRVTTELKECLGSEVIRRDGRDVADLSNDSSSVEMISRTMILKYSPVAR